MDSVLNVLEILGMVPAYREWLGAISVIAQISLTKFLALVGTELSDSHVSPTPEYDTGTSVVRNISS